MKHRILAVIAALVLGTASAGGDGSIWVLGGDGSIWVLDTDTASTKGKGK